MASYGLMNENVAWRRTSACIVVLVVTPPRTATRPHLQKDMLHSQLHLLLHSLFGSIGPKKLVHNSHDAQIGSCVDSSCAIPMACLNAAAFDNPDSLISLLTLLSVLSCSPTPALIDSGSSHCCINLSFVAHMNIATQNISPLHLHLLNGSNTNIISCSVEIPVIFPCGTSFTLDCLITLLDPNCPLVLRH